MQDDTSTTSSTTRTKRNGKWQAKDIKTAAPVDTDVELGVEGVMDTARSAYSSILHRGSDMISSVDFRRATGLVRSYPLQAAVGGLVIGFLLGSAMRRR